MTFIDTHAHIYDDKFDADRMQNGLPVGTRNDMLARAWALPISQIWMPNCARETVPGMMALAKQYPDRCLPMMGLHPTYVCETVEDELAAIEHQLNQYNYMAVGEIGLDFYWDMTHIDRQFAAFRTQLQWAAQRKLFVSLHTRSGHDRNAFAEAADVIEQLALPDLTGIFHCFVGTLDEARRAIGMGFKLGIGGVVTFKNGGLDRVLPYIGLEHIVLETDSPYLAPVPYRGKRNEPAYLQQIAQRIAELTGVTIAEVARQTTTNAEGLLSTTF